MAPVPAGQELYHLQVICMKNSKALFSSEHAHPHCPMSSVTQTITPSPQARCLGLGEGTRTAVPRLLHLVRPQEVELEAHLWHWKERPSQLKEGLRATQHSSSNAQRRTLPVPGNLTVSNSGATVFKLRCFRFNLAPHEAASGLRISQREAGSAALEEAGTPRALPPTLASITQGISRLSHSLTISSSALPSSGGPGGRGVPRQRSTPLSLPSGLVSQS